MRSLLFQIYYKSHNEVHRFRSDDYNLEFIMKVVKTHFTIGRTIIKNP